MKLSKEVIEKCHRFDLDLNKEEHKFFKNYGLEQIKEDDEALINYAINKILSKVVKGDKK